MSQFGGKPYQEWMITAKRFDRCVDFGSPISAWTPQMLAQKRAEDARLTAVVTMNLSKQLKGTKS